MDLSPGIVGMEAKNVIAFRRRCVKFAVMLWYWALLAAASLANFRACIRLKPELTRSFDLGKLERKGLETKKIRRGCVKLSVMLWYWDLLAAAPRAIFRICICLKHRLTRSFDLGKFEMDLSAGVVGMEAKKIRRGCVKLAVMLWYWRLLAAAPRAIFRACIRLKHELTRWAKGKEMDGV